MNWNQYPPDYRAAVTAVILKAARAGECVALAGLSGSGKSNLLGFLANRVEPPPAFLVLDCNRLAEPTAAAFWQLAARRMGAGSSLGDPLGEIEAALERALRVTPSLCWLIDRYDALPQEVQAALSGNLRALRDAFKYSLSFLVAGRKPPDPHGELAELFYAHTLWLGPLAEADARWSAETYAERSGKQWDDQTLAQLLQISGCYPAFLRACCEAAAAGCTLKLDVLRLHPAVVRRLEEFWADRPSQEELAQSGLTGNPLLSEKQSQDEQLTASEHRLLQALQAQPGRLIEKDDLIRQVWPGDRVSGGLRDDALAQLVRRLRKKVGEDRIETLPGRGYRWRGE